MRKFAAAIAILVAVCVAAVYAAPQQKAQKAAGKTHQVQVEVVSVDTTGKTVTAKTAEGQSYTYSLEGSALKRINNLKVGEKITATCRDNEQGEHQAIVAFRPAKK